MDAQETEVRGSAVGPYLDVERLLVPIDFSSASRDAFRFAMRMSEVWRSKVIAFYAPGSDANDEFLRYTGVPWGRSDVLAEAYDQLSRFVEAVVPGSAAAICIDALRHDSPVVAIVEACGRHKPSFVVLGAHWKDRRRWSRSRSERIMRAVACPVILVRGEREPVVDADE
jgi:nucleotide-binding universal stress UspA family protein